MPELQTTHLDVLLLITVTLDKAELKVADWLAKHRCAKGGKPMVMDQHRVELWRHSVAGELAFAKWANLWPDLARIGGMWDCVLPTGLTCDIKTTTRTDGNLVVHKSRAAKPCDVYVLVVSQRPTFGIIGWTHGALLFTDENTHELGHGPCFRMMRGDLFDPTENLITAPWHMRGKFIQSTGEQ